ncbi:MAG: glycosyltransferase [Fibrobacter sp.]|nr:glycosyltransferase [Fibrobacter sp.]
MRKHLYFYSDAPEWGGQEILAARIANILSENFKVHFFFSAKNFQTELLPAVEQIPLPFHSQGPFPILRDRIPGKERTARKLFEVMGAGKGDFKKLIVCPGNIERCIPGIRAARKLGLDVISYYPMAFSQKESRATLGFLRDWLAKSIYPLISMWIVNTPYQERLLRRFISKDTEVYQLPNPLTYKEDAAPKKPDDIKQVVSIGRLYFGQKGQQIIPEIAEYLDEDSKVRFHVIGQGPDADKLKKIADSKKVSHKMFYTPWASPTEIREQLLKYTDILLIPSKFESGPMVLFEALQCGVPILVADEDYVKDYHLPEWMTFKPGTPRDAAQKIVDMAADWNEDDFETTRSFLFAGRRQEEFRQKVIEIFSKLSDG